MIALGQIARDLVVLVDALPGPHGTTPVRERREMLGGKGTEAELLAGRPLRGAGDTVRAARELLEFGPGLVVLDAGQEGNVLVWDGGEVVVPLARMQGRAWHT